MFEDEGFPSSATVPDSSGMTALHWAALQGEPDVTKLLLLNCEGARRAWESLRAGPDSLTAKEMAERRELLLLPYTQQGGSPTTFPFAGFSTIWANHLAMLSLFCICSYISPSSWKLDALLAVILVTALLAYNELYVAPLTTLRSLATKCDGGLELGSDLRLLDDAAESKFNTFFADRCHWPDIPTALVQLCVAIPAMLPLVTVPTGTADAHGLPLAVAALYLLWWRSTARRPKLANLLTFNAVADFATGLLSLWSVIGLQHHSLYPTLSPPSVLSALFPCNTWLLAVIVGRAVLLPGHPSWPLAQLGVILAVAFVLAVLALYTHHTPAAPPFGDSVKQVGLYLLANGVGAAVQASRWTSTLHTFLALQVNKAAVCDQSKTAAD